MTLEEIKLRQLTNQHLLSPADAQTVARGLCGVQAQFLSNALHALRIRSNDFDGTELSGLVKSWTVRGTVHVFSEADLPLFLHRGRGHYLRPCDTLEGDGRVTRERKRYFTELIVESIAAGVSTREELKAVCLSHGLTGTEAESVFDPWGGTIRALCESGVICHELSEKKSFKLCPAFEPMEEDEARLEMARRYFSNFAPATVKDAAYFFGLTQTEVKKLIFRLPVMDVGCGGRTYFYIETDRDYGGEMPDCLFLAGFDQLMLGYQKTESLYLPAEHLRGIFNLAGIVMPAVLLRGRVVGRWKKKAKKLAVTLFESVGARDKTLVEECARALWPELRSVEFM